MVKGVRKRLGTDLTAVAAAIRPLKSAGYAAWRGHGKLTMKTTFFSCAAAFVAMAAAVSRGFAAEPMPDTDEIVLPGEYLSHLQDVCRDDSFVYWAHTQYIVKTDLGGNVVCKVEVEGHNAGCAVKDGRLYVAVCPLVPPPCAQLEIAPWTKRSRLEVHEYDADTLAICARHVLPANDRAGSLAVLDDGSFVVGCLRPGDISKTQVRFHHVSADFRLLSTHVVDDMEIPMGIETIKLIDGYLYMNCQHGPTLKVDPKTFEVVSRLNPFGGTRGYIADGERCWKGVSVMGPAVAVPERGKGRYRTWRSKLVREKRPAEEPAACR